MVHVAGVEAVEIVEPQAVGPAVERPGRACLPGRRVVVLADPGGHVAVLAQHLADGAGRARQDRRVAVVPGRRLGDGGGRRRVVVAPGDQRRAGRRAERGGVEAVVAQPLLGQRVHRRRAHAAAEGRELPEPRVVEQDQHDVRRPFRRRDRLRELRRVGLKDGAADVAGEMEVGPRQDRRGGRLRPGHRLLRCGRDHEADGAKHRRENVLVHQPIAPLRFASDKSHPSVPRTTFDRTRADAT